MSDIQGVVIGGDAKPPLPDYVGASIACPCHQQGGACGGAIFFQFPTSMFSVGEGRLQHRMHRSRFIQEMAALYDRYAEATRQFLVEHDPTTDRPPLEAIGMAMIDTSALAAATAEEPANGDDDSQAG